VISFSGSLRVMVSLESCDMRKGFNGLLALVGEGLGENASDGTLYVFSNRRRTRLKILYFDGSGLWVLSKRLEKGTFSWPQSAESGSKKMRLAPEAFAMLTDGIDLKGAKMRPWYGRT
jgi:transposase